MFTQSVVEVENVITKAINMNEIDNVMTSKLIIKLLILKNMRLSAANAGFLLINEKQRDVFT